MTRISYSLRMSVIKAFILAASLFILSIAQAADSAQHFDGVLGEASSERANFAALFGRMSRGKIIASFETLAPKPSSVARQGVLIVRDEVSEIHFAVEYADTTGAAPGSLEIPSAGKKSPARTLTILFEPQAAPDQFEISVMNTSQKHLLFKTL